MILKRRYLEDIEQSLKKYTDLHLVVTQNEIKIEGQWLIEQDGIIIQTYDVQISIPEGYPTCVPIVYETGGKIPKKMDRHINPATGDACLFVEDERWEIWPIGSSFINFLKIPLHNFFLYQAYYEVMGHFPLGERSHGVIGKIEYFSEKLQLDSEDNILDILRAGENSFNENLLCPCGKIRKFRYCHSPKVQFLRRNINPDIWKKTLGQLKERRLEKRVHLIQERKIRLEAILATSPWNI
jgi:hypothetical protein